MGIDWLSSMKRTYEYYEIDPGTWENKRLITQAVSGSIKRDFSSNTLETASFVINEDVTNEFYIRPYMIIIQNGVQYPGISMGTFLVQTPGKDFDGKVLSTDMDAYSPLLELKDDNPDLGFTLLKGSNVMDQAYKETAAHIRAPVIKVSGINKTLHADFTAEATESWLDYNVALMANANYYYMLDEIGRVIFCPSQDLNAMQPVWEFNDGNSSILYPKLSDKLDFYGIPNVVEVSYSTGGTPLYSRVENNDKNSPTSIQVRGRQVIHRETNPTISGTPTQEYIDQYAKDLLKSLNSIEHTLTYSHGYCPVRIGDCVLLNYERAGLKNIKARIKTQDFKLDEACEVSETAVYTVNFLEGND